MYFTINTAEENYANKQSIVINPPLVSLTNNNEIYLLKERRDTINHVNILFSVR